MPVAVTSTAVYTCDSCHQAFIEGIVFIGGFVTVTDGAQSKPSGKAVAFCSKDCAKTLVELELAPE